MIPEIPGTTTAWATTCCSKSSRPRQNANNAKLLGSIRAWRQYHVDLGRALEAQQKFEDAEQAYRDAIRLDPDHGVAHDTLSWLLMGQQRYAEAEVEFREVARLRPDSGQSSL